MIVRLLDQDHDWTFGKGKNDYLKNNAAVAQCIQTRLLSFVQDCFFDAEAGLDWWNLLGGKSLEAVKIAVSKSILNTPGVTALVQLSAALTERRELKLEYQVVTVYSLNKSTSGSVTVGGSIA